MEKYTDVTPIMAANTTTIDGKIYKAFADSESGGYPAYYAFDNKPSTRWALGTSGGGSITLDLGENNSKVIGKIDIYKSPSQVKDFEIYFSQDGVKYELMHGASYSDANGIDLKECIINKPKSTRFIKIKVVTVFGYGASIWEIKIYSIKLFKYLIRQNDKLYTFNGTNVLESPSQILDDTNFKINGFEDTSILTKEQLKKSFKDMTGLKLVSWTDDVTKINMNMVYNCDAFRPIDKFDKSKPLEIYKCIEK